MKEFHWYSNLLRASNWTGHIKPVSNWGLQHPSTLMYPTNLVSQYRCICSQWWGCSKTNSVTIVIRYVHVFIAIIYTTWECFVKNIELSCINGQAFHYVLCRKGNDIWIWWLTAHQMLLRHQTSNGNFVVMFQGKCLDSTSISHGSKLYSTFAQYDYIIEICIIWKNLWIRGDQTISCRCTDSNIQTLNHMLHTRHH